MNFRGLRISASVPRSTSPPELGTRCPSTMAGPATCLATGTDTATPTCAVPRPCTGSGVSSAPHGRPQSDDPGRFEHVGRRSHPAGDVQGRPLPNAMTDGCPTLRGLFRRPERGQLGRPLTHCPCRPTARALGEARRPRGAPLLLRVGRYPIFGRRRQSARGGSAFRPTSHALRLRGAG